MKCPQSSDGAWDLSTNRHVECAIEGYHDLVMHSRIRELIEYLDAERAVLNAAFDAVPPAAREVSPAPDCWSPANTIEHLAIVEERLAGVLSKKIDAARAEGAAADLSTDPILPTLRLAWVRERGRRVEAPAPIRPTGLSAEAAWQALERGGESIRAVLRAAADVNLGVITHPHPLFGPMTL